MSGARAGGSSGVEAGMTSSGGDAGSFGAGGDSNGGNPQTDGGNGASGGVFDGAGAPGSGGSSGAGVGAGGSVMAGGRAGSGGMNVGGVGAGGSCATSETSCGAKCVDTTTDKANCGACGTACEGYQFCSAGKCIPTYQSTRVQPLTSGSSGVSALSGAVAKNKPQGDLVLQLNGGVTLSSADAALITTLSGAGYARYTAAGVLVWGRSSKQLLNNDDLSYESPVALTGTGDLAVAYQRYVPATGPVSGTYHYLLGRIGGNNGTLVWEADYYKYSSSGAIMMSGIVPRSAKSDFIAYVQAQTFQLGGDIYQFVDSGTAGSGTKLTPSFMFEAAAGADGATLWSWGAVDGWNTPAQLNPWSSQTWQLTTNPSQFSGGDVYILGAKDDGTTIGPWFSEGDYGMLMHMVVDSAGDLIVVARSAGYVTFNGGQDFFTTTSGGVQLAKIRHTDGKVLWRTPLPTTSLPDRLVLAPGDRVVTTDTTSSDGSYTLGIYSGADGALLSRIPVSSKAPVQVLAAGNTEMFLVGSVSTALDFNPGAATDTQGATAGLFISRYAF